MKNYATTLRTDSWNGVRCEDRVLSSPSWDEVEAAIRHLDGARHTIANIESDGPARIVVGGGERGKYVVWVTFDNEKFHKLMSNEQSEEKDILFIGGQEGDYMKDIIVDIQSALKAARAFYEFGRLDEALKWKV